MAEICSCTSGITNFGQPPCVDSFSPDARLVFVQYYDNLGAVNSIASTDTLDASYFEDRINAGNYDRALDKSKRWYFTETINSVEGERAESVKQEVDGISFNVKQGLRSYSGTFYGGIASPKYVGALRSLGCLQMGYFVIDTNGAIIGQEFTDSSGDVFLNPIKMQRNTLDAIYKKPSKTEVQSIMLSFMVEENEKDETLSFIPSDDIAVDTLMLRSVATVNGSVSTASATTFTLVADYTYGTAFVKQPFVGLTSADVIPYNVTQSTSPLVVSVAESPDGTYLVTIDAQTTSDVISVNIDKAGFEMTEVTYVAL
jgi:hypothetical protein